MARSFVSRFNLVLTRFATLVATAKSAIQHRRSVRQLAMFDDRMLRDIGLIRQDISSALAMPLLADPSLALVERVSASRAGARAQAWDNRARLAATPSDVGVSEPASRRAA